jgi:tetratricopeptide (TPR) repeat protein
MNLKTRRATAPVSYMNNLDAELAQLETAQLVRRVEDEEETYVFRHVLVQDAASESLLNQERKRLHLLVAGILEEMHADRLDEYAAVLAHHYLQTDETGKTVEFAVRAAEADHRVFADTEARTHYMHALTALARMPDSPSIQRQKIDLSLRLLEIRWSAGTPEQDLAYLDELEKSALTLAAGEDPLTEDRLRLARIRLNKGGVYFEMNQTTPVIRVSQQSLIEAKELGDKDLLATASLLIGGALTIQGFFGKALSLLEQAWQNFKNQPERWEWASLIFLGTALAHLGRIKEAHTLVRGELERLDRSRISPPLTFAYLCLTLIAWVERSMDTVIE